MHSAPALACHCTDCDAAGSLLGSFLLFFTFFWNAYLMVVYTNRFTTEEFGHNIWMYASMGCTALMALSAIDCVGDSTHCASILSSANGAGGTASFPIFAAAVGVTNALTGLQFLRTVHMVRARSYSALYGGGCLVAAGVWCVAAATAHTPTAHVAVAGAVSLWHVAVDACTRLRGIDLPTRLPDHKASRFRKFGVVMLTQLLMGVLAPGLPYSGPAYTFAAGVLALTVLHKMVHYDFNQGHKAHGWSGVPAVSEWLYVICNLVLAAAFTALGAVVHSVTRDVSGNGSHIPYARRQQVKWLMCGSMALALLASVIIQAVLKGKGKRVRRCGKTVRVSFRVLLALVTVLLPLILPHSFPTHHIIWLLVGVVLVELVGDIVGRQQVRRPAGEARMDVYSEAVGLGDPASARRKSKVAASFQTALWRVVRQGEGAGGGQGPGVNGASAPLLPAPEGKPA